MTDPSALDKVRLADLFPNDEAPIIGYEAIARAVSRLLNISFCVRTAVRRSQFGVANRLPVYRFAGSNHVFMLSSHLIAWARLSIIPSGAYIPRPAKKKKKRPKPARPRAV